ncbi:MAG: hypothetical protein ABL918_11925 [Chakrabartia sp.]
MTVIVAVLTATHPYLLAGNRFLNSFVSHEILAVLIVTLTITLASIGNIHLTISRLVRKFENLSQGELEATPARTELNSSAWSLFWAFGVCVCILLFKGGFPENCYVVSFVNGAALIILSFNMMALYDIYTTVFDLVKEDPGET